MRISLFYQSGELEFKRKAQAQGHTLEYVGDDPDYWNKDIDFIIDDGTTVEVKWDSWINTTGNLFIETDNPRSRCGLGWFRFTQAEWLAYGNSQTNEFYMIKMQDLRNYIEKHNPERKITNDGAEGFLVPLKSLQYQIL